VSHERSRQIHRDDRSWQRRVWARIALDRLQRSGSTPQARIELDRGNLERAERFARRGAEQAVRVRSTQSTIALRPWVLEKRRAPDELLFIAFARSSQVEAAAMAFDESLTASRSRPHRSKVGSLTEIHDLADQFRGHPTDVELASRLGALLLPHDAFRETREVAARARRRQAQGIAGFPNAKLVANP